MPSTAAWKADQPETLGEVLLLELAGLIGMEGAEVMPGSTLSSGCVGPLAAVMDDRGADNTGGDELSLGFPTVTIAGVIVGVVVPM